MNPISALVNLIGTIFSSLGDGIAWMTGGLENRRRKMGQNVHVIEQKFKNAKTRKLNNANELLEAIGSLEIAKTSLEKEIGSEKALLSNADENRQGAAALAKERVAYLGNDREKAANDPVYLKHKSAYERYNEDYEDAKKRLEGDGTETNIGLRAELRNLTEEIEGYDRQLKSMTQDVTNIDRRKGRLISDLKSADSREAASRRVTGLSLDNEDADLKELEEIGMHAKARSNVAARLAGSTTQSQDAEYKAAARRSVTGDSFDALMNFDKKTLSLPVPDSETVEN